MAKQTDTRVFLSLEELQQVNLELLLDFDELCKELNVEYALCGGTMLGAARHAGFIPWDDDIDVMMLRAEYEKLLAGAQEANAQWEDRKRKIISNRDGSFARDYARFIRLDYGKDEEGVSPRDCPWVGIDIFPIETISDDQAEFEKQVKDRQFWKEVFTTCSSPFNAGSTPVKRAVRNVFRPVAACIGGSRAGRKSEEICRRFENTDGKDIAIVCGMYGTRERWPRSCYEPLQTLPFEGHQMPVPHDWDTYMRAIYGADYMELPPVEKRRAPHIKAWKIEDESQDPRVIAQNGAAEQEKKYVTVKE